MPCLVERWLDSLTAFFCCPALKRLRESDRFQPQTSEVREQVVLEGGFAFVSPLVCESRSGTLAEVTHFDWGN